MARLAICDIEIPSIDEMMNVMETHFENGRFTEAWELREHWIMELKSLNKWKPKTLENIDFKHKKMSEIQPLSESLQQKYDDLDSEVGYVQRRIREGLHVIEIKKKTLATYSEPYIYLEYIENQINLYGRNIDKGDRELNINMMNTLIFDMHLFFNVWDYDDLFKINDENIRLKIGELARLNMKYQGKEFTNKEPVEDIAKERKNGLFSLL